MNVFEKQIPTRLEWLAGLFKSCSAINKVESVVPDVFGNLLDDLIYSRVGAKSQRVEIQSARVVTFCILIFAEIFVRRRETEVGIGITRIYL